MPAVSFVARVYNISNCTSILTRGISRTVFNNGSVWLIQAGHILGGVAAVDTHTHGPRYHCPGVFDLCAGTLQTVLQDPWALSLGYHQHCAL